MANLTETSTFDSGVYQIETTDPVSGGSTGIANKPLINLANRTKYLKDHLDAIEAGTTTLPGYAKIASPTFTGTPAAPTPPLGDNDTSLATSEFVQGTVGGRLAKSVAGGSNVTLTAVEAGNAILELSGAITANISLIVPTLPTKFWIVKNGTSGAFTVTVKTAAGNGVVVAQGKTGLVYSDGTNVVEAGNDILARILAVDGAGSGIDADLLDGQHGSFYAPVASPTLTGTPAAPTAAAGTNTTQIATTAFVSAAVAGVAIPFEATATNIKQNGTQSVGALSTVARADHVHPTDTTRAPVASPTFTGTPAAPTAAVGTNTTQLATTAFVQAEIANDSAPVSHVGATGTAHGVATTAVAGFMSSTDKSKLDGIAAGAQANTVTSVAGKTGAVSLSVSDVSGAAPTASPTLSGTPSAPTPATGTNNTQLATTAFVKSQIANDIAGLVSAGSVQYFAMTTPPSGWIQANGAAISRTTYSALFSAIGTTFGAGDGSTTFNIPDLRGEFLRGWDNGRGVDAGRGFGSVQGDEFRSHSHTAWGNAVSSPQYGEVPNPSWFGGLLQTSNTGGNETRPRNVALLACIKF